MNPLESGLEKLMNEPETSVENSLPAFSDTTAIYKHHNEEKEKYERVAKRVLKNLYGFYHKDLKAMSKDKWLQTKIKIDALSFSSLSQQINIAEKAISMLVTQIEMAGGVAAPRMWEVLSTMQKTVGELILQYNRMMIQMSNSARDTVEEWKKNSNVIELNTNNKKKSMGMRNLLMNLEKEKDDEDDDFFEIVGEK